MPTPKWRKALDEAAASGQPVSAGGPDEWRLFYPVYTPGSLPHTPEERRRRLAGFFVGQCQLADLPSLAAGTDRDAIKVAVGTGEEERPPALEYVEPVEVGGQHWQIVCTAGPDYPATNHAYSWGVGLAGLAIVVVAAGAIGLMLARQQSLGQLAARRDSELHALADVLATSKMSMRETEARYRQLVDVCPEAILIYRQDQVEFVNPAALAPLGADRADQLMGKSAFELIHPDFHARTRERLRLLIEEGRAAPLLEQQIVRLDGTTVEVEAASAPFRHGTGVAIQAILRDITARKRAEESLRQVEAETHKLALIASRTDNGVILTDADGLVEWVNEGFTRISGYTLDEVRGKSPGSVLQGPATDPDTVAHMREHIAGVRASTSR